LKWKVFEIEIVTNFVVVVVVVVVVAVVVVEERQHLRQLGLAMELCNLDMHCLLI